MQCNVYECTREDRNEREENEKEINITTNIAIADIANTAKPQESKEICPEFYPITHIPYDKMWQDTHLWFPDALKGKRLQGTVIYGEDNEQVVKHQLTEWLAH